MSETVNTTNTVSCCFWVLHNAERDLSLFLVLAYTASSSFMQYILCKMAGSSVAISLPVSLTASPAKI